MKLLIVTQTLDKNDPILGFFHRWACPVKSRKAQICTIRMCF